MSRLARMILRNREMRMAESTNKHEDGNGGAAVGHDGPGESGRPARPATLAESLAAGLSELFTRRRQSRLGLYAPLVQVERSD